VRVKIRTLTTGKQNKKGYTLIELAVVVLLISLMLLLAVPRVRDTLLNDSLKSAARHIIGTARELRYDAVREQVDYVLHIDLGSRTIWTYSADMTPEKKDQRKKDAYRLPDDLKILDIYHPEGEKKNEGEDTITFFSKGYIQPSILHLARGDRAVTLVFQPFLTGIKIYEEYVDFSFSEGISKK
jgi:general secretion pathway protein H